MKIISFITVLILSASLLHAQTQPAPKLPPNGEQAAQALKDSTRHGEWIDVPLKDAKEKVHTWIVYPERKEKAPVVIVIHEIFGLTDWVRAVADQLAAEGFIAVAPDLLSGKGPDGGGTDSFKGDAVREAIQKLSTTEVTERLNAVRAHALALPAASVKSASIGFCWGGSASFNYATEQKNLNAAVVYYGTAPTDPDTLARIPCPVLGLYGKDDARVTKTVEQTEKLMMESGKSYTPRIYDGAGHAFLRQQSAKEGNMKAAQQGWSETIKFLKTNLE